LRKVVKTGFVMCLRMRGRAPSDIKATHGAHPGARRSHDFDSKHYFGARTVSFKNVRFRYNFSSIVTKPGASE